MTNLDKQLEELIKERNDFEAENIALKAQVEKWRTTARYTRKINNRLASEFIKDMNPDDVDLVWLERDQIKELSELEQVGGLNSIKADAIGNAAQRFNYEYDGLMDASSIESFFDDMVIKLRNNNG